MLLTVPQTCDEIVSTLAFFFAAIWLLHHLHMQELEDKKLVAIEKEEKAREVCCVFEGSIFGA